MKKTLTVMALSGLMLASYASPRRMTDRSAGEYVEALAKRSFNTDRGWRNAAPANTGKPARVVSATDAKIGPASYWGSLTTPDGEEWIYLAKFNTENLGEYMTTIKSAEITIYDANFNEYKTFTADFDLREGETSINLVQVAPILTRKFFNINDSYEVMLYVHATTEDYAGAQRTFIYTLSDGSKIGEFEGNNIAAIDTATDSWSEKYTMVFMREETILGEELDEDGFPQYTYMLYFDVFSKAGWSTGPQLEHTFAVDYSKVSGSGDAALPILVNVNDGKLWYALPYYEKPYFENMWSDDVTPDNHFIIDLYDSEFNLVKTTTMPIELEEGAFFSFPGLGEFRGFDDLCFDYTADGTPVYIVGVESYITSVDDFTTSLFVYDLDGNLLDTIVEHADDYMPLADVEGQQEQWCFFYNLEESSYFKMVDFPSLSERATIPVLQQGVTISTSIDRVPVGSEYKYVSSILTADVDNHDNVIHKFAWLNTDGSFDRFDRINLGNKVIMAQAYIGADAFNPYLFNTDNNYEYMFLVKEPESAETTRSKEYLRVYSDNSELLLNLGPNDETGEKLNSIFLSNVGTNKAKLIVTYYADDQYNVHFIELPFSQFAGGDGTVASPYQISSPGDLLSVYKHPSAYYEIVEDIDFESMPIHGNKCAFYGSIDGKGHTVANFTLVNSSLISEIYESAKIHDIVFKNVSVEVDNGEEIGVLVSQALGSASNKDQVSNIVIDGLTVKGNGAATFGGLIGHSAVYSTVTGCAVVNADIDLPRGSAGGIVGLIGTGSSISNCLVDGTINSATAGGVVGESFTGDETITNCHVKADITGRRAAGGVIGESARTIIDHCYVEGSVTATSGNGPQAGGIAGYVKSTYETDNPIMIHDNIMAAAIVYNAEAAEPKVHRIAGFTSIDEKLVNWESQDPNVDWNDPSTYPYLPGKLEAYMRNNYAIGVERIDDTVADDPDSTEGASADAVTANLLETLEWKLGDNADAPWINTGAGLVLWFEDYAYNSITDINSDKVSAAVRYDGESVIGVGAIEVYNAAGMLVAKGRDTVGVRHLPKGVYVVRTTGGSAKFAL